MSRPRTKFLRLTVAALYALAMLMVGAVRHDIVGSASAVDREAFSASYALPNGEAAILCQHGTRGDNPGQGVPSDHGCCDACLLTHAPGLGAIAPVGLPHPPVGSLIVGISPMPVSIAALPPEPLSRGPPVG
jgi:hypothetical protein